MLKMMPLMKMIIAGIGTLILASEWQAVRDLENEGLIKFDSFNFTNAEDEGAT